MYSGNLLPVFRICALRLSLRSLGSVAVSGVYNGFVPIKAVFMSKLCAPGRRDHCPNFHFAILVAFPLPLLKSDSIGVGFGFSFTLPCHAYSHFWALANG